MGRGRSRRAKAEEPLLDKLVRTTLPRGHVVNDYVLTDAPNTTDADQRHAMRSGAVRTIRRKTRIEKLVTRKVITPEQAKACQWYADMYETGYQTGQGTTANYGGEGGQGNARGHDHMARNVAQYRARQDWLWAREAITPGFVRAFDDIVLNGASIGEVNDHRDAPLAFKLCAQSLLARVSERL